jgi:hypothetical protein
MGKMRINCRVPWLSSWIGSGSLKNDLVIPVLQQKGDYVAVVDPDRTFRGLIDRAAVLESLASEYVRQADSKKI